LGAGYAEQQNGRQSARNISKSVDHGRPLVVPSGRRLTVDGGHNMAMRDFAG
jgi:hypothetical protein